MTIERRSIPPADRGKEILAMWEAGLSLSEIVLQIRYSPQTIALDLLTAKWPEQADRKRAFAAWNAVKYGLFGYDPRDERFEEDGDDD